MGVDEEGDSVDVARPKTSKRKRFLPLLERGRRRRTDLLVFLSNDDGIG